MAAKHRSFPTALQSYLPKLGLSWQIRCIIDNEAAKASPYTLSKQNERVHELIIQDFQYAHAADQPFRKAWLLILATLVLAETRDPIFSDNKTMDIQRLWELFAVYLLISMWSYDLLIERLPDEMDECLRSELEQHHRLIPAAITGDYRPTEKLYAGLGCARLRAVLLRADKALGTSLAEKFQVDWDGLKRVAQPTVELLTVSDLYAGLPPLAQTRQTAMVQLELAAQSLMSTVRSNTNADIIERDGRYWWR